jgi:hypothetical protein
MKCKNCKDKFDPKKFNWKWCDKEECNNVGVSETLEKARKQISQKKRLEKAKAKENLLTHKDYLKLLQTAFNAYIRKRDKDLPCISCGKNDNSKQYHAGHYRSVGSCPELRFEELNVHKQCAKCNNYLHGNLIKYRIELIDKIGLKNVEWLEFNHKPNKLSMPEIKELIQEYKIKIKNIKIN